MSKLYHGSGIGCLEQAKRVAEIGLGCNGIKETIQIESSEKGNSLNKYNARCENAIRWMPWSDLSGAGLRFSCGGLLLFM
jgi:hypothetical protein